MSFDQALLKIAQHDNNLALWDFASAVYGDERNWKEFKPNEIEIEPGRIAIINRHKKGGNAVPLLPVYPTSLNDLNISLKS
ncbi:MAG: hypothetical protein HXX20_06335 [Chloroflexi bacterium]|nr:hypothetical protein [Chloroflexota bacterium]